MTEDERTRMVLAHLPLVWHCLGEITVPPRLDYSDLYQDGVLALLGSIDGWHAERGDFLPYAHTRVRGALVDAADRYAWPLGYRRTSRRAHRDCSVPRLVGDRPLAIRPAPGVAVWQQAAAREIHEQNVARAKAAGAVRPATRRPSMRKIAGVLNAVRAGKPIKLAAAVAGYKKRLVVAALRCSHGSQAAAAKLLGITQRSMWHRVKTLGIDVKEMKTCKRSG